MSKPIIVSPRRLPAALSGVLGGRYTLRLPEQNTISGVSLAAFAEGAQALCVTAFDALDRELIAQFPESIKMIASFGVGVDHIDLEAARERGIVVSNTPDVTTPCLADATMGLIIAACRRFREGLDIARTGEGRGMLTPDAWGQRVSGRTLGIVGMGNVGREVAKRACGFDLDILYTTPRPTAQIDEAYGARAVSLDELLAKADIVSLHCPLKDDTRHMIDARAIEKMKPGAVIINIARGPIIDELALIEALKTGRLFAAGLDVFETEPDPIREALYSLPNVFCLPHIASATLESRGAMAMRFVANLDTFFETGDALDPV